MGRGSLGQAAAPLFALVFLLASLAFGAKTLWTLVLRRRWLRLLSATPIALIGPTVLYLLLRARELPDSRQRDWFMITGVTFLFVWIFLWGFVLAMLTDVSADSSSSGRFQWTTRRQKGAWLLTFGLVAWIIGASAATLPKTYELLLLLVWGYGTFVGTYWLSTGKRVND